MKAVFEQPEIGLIFVWLEIKTAMATVHKMVFKFLFQNVWLDLDRNTVDGDIFTDWHAGTLQPGIIQSVLVRETCFPSQSGRQSFKMLRFFFSYHNF